MNTFLAIDGGNSKTEVLLADTAGTVLGYARGAGSNHQTVGGIGAAMSRLDGLVRLARDRAGVGADVRPALAAVYLAGADLPVELAALNDAVTAAGWAEKSIVDNDVFALLRAGTEAPDAVAVICGAGTNCVGRAADGRLVRFPALGQISGDWGGGQHLGALALWHAARAEDGRGPATALVDAVARHFGHPRIADVITAIHLGEVAYDRLADLAPAVLAASAAGDQVARALVVRQGEEIVTMATAALRRLDLRTSPVAVVLGGGVLRTHDPTLFGVITDRLRTAAPRAEITLVSDPPVLGAALLALDALGIDGSAHDHLRAQVRRITARR
ncbi:MAG TPA: BadF/BadG/BcrA/BcrD ATPase family protein [Actinophytocola sp.]|uniref:N-acetylglucosamine kinase n=1 Tax=Actinophytocola sp. TaxID=1872138 RepID=UPI002DDDB4FF|nr:BadF/BadG/BcrA/BcrD ATPase family protein [Actinophytocola sp.]HEV2784354.1 BadF/BadG/BcrA/BcrD ATPase family protein [Actinophytocola sp.]